MVSGRFTGSSKPPRARLLEGLERIAGIRNDIAMPKRDPTAVAVACANTEAGRGTILSKPRKILSPTSSAVTTTQPGMKDVKTTGADAHMAGLKQFAQTVEQARSSRGEEIRNEF